MAGSHINYLQLCIYHITTPESKVDNTALKVNEFCQTLKKDVPEEHYLLIQSGYRKAKRRSVS